MESGSQAPREAEDLLAAHDLVAERARAQRLPREAAYFSLWLGILTTAYLTVFLITFDVADDFSPTFLMLVPLLAASFLTNGALERFGIRLKTPTYVWAGFYVGMVCFLVLMALTLTNTPYPWWWRLVLIAVFLVTFGALSLHTFSRSVRDHHSTWTALPLSLPSRVSSWILAGVLGALIATSASLYATVASSFTAMIALFTVVATSRTRFGLPNVGFEWSRVHWIAFTFAVTLCFGTALLRAYASWFTLPAAILLGVIAASAMAIPALRQRESR